VGCPDCGCKQFTFHNGYQGSRNEPAEPAGFMCDECGHTWPGEEPDPDEYGDWKFHDKQDMSGDES